MAPCSFSSQLQLLSCFENDSACPTPVIKGILWTPIIYSLKEDGIAFSLTDYLELADWTGRIVREDKRGYIEANTPGILQKLQLDEQTWMETVQGFSKGFHSFVGPEEQLKSLCQKQKRHWVRGINACRKLFKSNPPITITT